MLTAACSLMTVPCGCACSTDSGTGRRSRRNTVMLRGGRSTVSPARAYSYSALPSFLSAECMGGTCCCGPVKRSSTAAMSASLTATGRSCSTSPSASPVVVVTPRRNVASYALSASRCIWLNLVAAPKHSGSTPVASGSRVPVWPAFSARSNHLTFCKAWLLESPSGLSSSSTPCTGRRCTLVRGAAVMVIPRLWNGKRLPWQLVRSCPPHAPGCGRR